MNIWHERLAKDRGVTYINEQLKKKFHKPGVVT